jgi:CRP/FNR family transcriptional regulator, cyclic AMP receptor protein
MDITPLIRAVEAARGEDAFSALLSAAQWLHLATALERRELHPGELLMRRGETDAAAYFVQAGELQVFVTGGPPGSHRIATLRAGALVGEPALFVDLPRMAHVEAMSACVVWALPAAGLQRLGAEAPELALTVLRGAGAVMAARMRANLERGIPIS